MLIKMKNPKSQWLTNLILAIWEAEIVRVVVQASPSKNVSHINGKKLDLVAQVCHPSNSVKFKIGGSLSRSIWTKSKTLSPK
jgi:hypothetical protein